MMKNRSLDRTKTSWRSRDKNFLSATSWYQSNFPKPSTAIEKRNSISRGISSSNSFHKFRSRYIPLTLCIRQNRLQQNEPIINKSKSLIKSGSSNIYLSQDKLLRIFYRRIQADRSNLLQKQFAKLKQQLPKTKKLSQEKQVLIVEDFLKKMNFFRELKEDELFKEKMFGQLINDLEN